MRRHNNHTIWFAVFLLLIFSSGCCNPGAKPVLTPPTVISVAPLSGAAGLCPNTTVTATFSVAMNSTSINGTTFTLTGPGTTPVAGVVTYDASSNTRSLRHQALSHSVPSIPPRLRPGPETRLALR
jgi:hypothetical protein